MTREELIKIVAKTYADAVEQCEKGNELTEGVINKIAYDAFMYGFNNGIVFKTWDKIGDDFYNISTEADWYEGYIKKDISEGIS